MNEHDCHCKSVTLLNKDMIPNYFLFSLTNFSSWSFAALRFLSSDVCKVKIQTIAPFGLKNPHISQVKVMVSRFPIWKPALGNKGPSGVGIQQSFPDLVDRMRFGYLPSNAASHAIPTVLSN